MRLRTIFKTLLAVGLMAATSINAAVVTNFQVYSTNLSADMDVSVAVPAEYADSTHKSYPVLYCLHGSNSPYTTYTSMSPLLNAIDDKYPMLIVTYGAGNSMYAGGHQPWFFDELVPYIEANYRVIADSTKRAITGFSMGGYGSYLFMVLRPTFFSSVISLSGVFFSDIYNGIDTMIAHGTAFPGLFLDCGTADALLYHSQEMHAFLDARGLDHIYGESLGRAHDWSYWRDMSDSCAAVAWRYFDDVPPLAPTGLSGTPTENAVTLTWTASAQASDGDGAKMYAVHRDGTPVDTVFGTTFTDIDLTSETAYAYAVYAIDDAYHPSATAAEVTVTTTVDNDAPEAAAVISWGLEAVRIDFDEAVTAASAENTGNYSLTGGVTVTGAELTAPRTVVLSTSFQDDGVEYTLSVSGITDLSPAANTIGTAQQTAFTARACFFDDFESGLTSAWGPDATGWSITADGGSDVLRMEEAGSAVLRLDREYDTFTLDARVRAEDESTYRHVKIVFGYSDDDNFYDVDFGGVRHDSYNGIFRTASGDDEKIAGDDAEPTLTDSSAWYHVRVEVDADAKTCRAFCGDTLTPVFEADIPDYAGGKIGLWTNRGKLARFDDIVISQYLRDGDWAGLAHTSAVPRIARHAFSNPASLRQLRHDGWQVLTLQGGVPADGYRGIVILKDAAGRFGGSAVLVK